MKIIKTAQYRLAATLNYPWREYLDKSIAAALDPVHEEWTNSLSDYDRQDMHSQDNKEKIVTDAVEAFIPYIPQELKTETGDLHPDFKGQIQSYVMSKYDVDPFQGWMGSEFEEEDDLENWWGPSSQS